ncbi:MAG: rhamnulokinase [Sphaerochaetaceae bacterium]
MAKHIAIDLGASNGRVIVGDLNSIEITNRFVTRSETLLTESYWDIPHIFGEIKKGIKEAFNRYKDEVISIGVDSWGVDYGLLDANGSLVTLPYHYRDGRTDGMVEKVCAILGKENVYRRTGVAFESYNTLYQLAAMQAQRPQTFAAVSRYLSLPDLITYWLTGIQVNEVTHASTTQLYNPTTGDWDWETIEGMGFSKKLFGPLVNSGTIVGPLHSVVAKELDAPPSVVVVAVGTHDTASAVAAIHSSSQRSSVFLSSGTWSLLGIETEKPIISEAALNSGLTNEKTVTGSIRFLKNIMGMWIQQECVRYWQEQGQTIKWATLDQQTLEASSYEGFIDPTDQRFLKAGTADSLMVDRIDQYCQEHGFAAPSSHGEYMVAVYRGLALSYKEAIEQMGSITDRTFETLHIIGGGCKNEILNQWAADSTRLQVYAGPSEATALGNILLQQVATKQVGSLETGRAQIAASQHVKRFDPQ